MKRGYIMKKKDTDARGTALVVEGGGMRGIFAAGVLDVFMERGFDPFDLFIGVSAGACNLASHLAAQHGRNFRIYTRIMTRPDFISAKKFLRGGHYMDLDYLWDAIDAEDPLDIPAIVRGRRDYLITATSVERAAPVYIAPTAGNCNDSLKASSSIPLLYRRFITVNGEALVDGGVSDPLPAREARRRGARTIVVIRTRPAAYVKKKGIENRVSSLATGRHPALSRAILGQAGTYGSCMDFILSPPADTRIFQVAPADALATGRTTQDVRTLTADYELGRKLGDGFIDRWEGRG